MVAYYSSLALVQLLLLAGATTSTTMTMAQPEHHQEPHDVGQIHNVQHATINGESGGTNVNENAINNENDDSTAPQKGQETQQPHHQHQHQHGHSSTAHNNNAQRLLKGNSFSTLVDIDQMVHSQAASEIIIYGSNRDTYGTELVEAAGPNGAQAKITNDAASVDAEEMDSNSSSQEEDDVGEVDVGEFSIANSSEENYEDDGEIDVGEFSMATSNQDEDENEMVQGGQGGTLAMSLAQDDPDASSNTIGLPPSFYENYDAGAGAISAADDDAAVVAESATTITTTSTSTTTVCTCSPQTFNFKLTLDQSCLTNDLKGKDGIGLTLCTKSGDTDNADPIAEIISVQFIEFDTSGSLTVINQNDEYSDVSFANGHVISFDSITNELDYTMPLENQMDKVPGGVQLLIRGKRAAAGVSEETGEDEEDGAVVSTRIAWSYTNGCDADVGLPVEDGDRIGWVTVEDVTPASSTFCPAAPSASTTTTIAATTTTPEVESTTTNLVTSPTASPTTLQSKTAKANNLHNLYVPKADKVSAKSVKDQPFAKAGKLSKSGKGDLDIIESMSMMSRSSSGKSGKILRSKRERIGQRRLTSEDFENGMESVGGFNAHGMYNLR